MDLNKYYKAVVDSDPTQVILCNTDHEILYMNDAAAEAQAKHGGRALIGHNLLDCHQERTRQIIQKILDWFKEDVSHNKIYFEKNLKKNKDVYMVALRDDDGEVIGYFEKHEFREYESKMKLYDFFE